MHAKKKNQHPYIWGGGKFILYFLWPPKTGKLCCYGQMEPSPPSSDVRNFSLCTNYFRLLLGNIGESLTFLYLFKFNHWNKHLKTH